MAHSQDVAALACDDLRWRDPHRFRRHLATTHHPIEHDRALVALLFEIRIHAGNRAMRAADGEQVILNADNGDFGWYANTRLLAKLLHFYRECPVGDKNRGGL